MADQPRVHVLLDRTDLSDEVREALEHVNANAAVHDFSGGRGAAETESFDARLIITADARTVTNGKLEMLHQWFDAAPCPTLVLSDTPVQAGFAPGVEASNARAIVFSSPLSKDELGGRLAAMCGLHRSMEVLRSELEELRQHDGLLRADLRRLQDELRLAGTLQHDLLPVSLPTVPGIEIDVLYRPAEMLSGDLYDVARLDDTHVGISLVDATGHGVAAALLAAYVKRWSGGRAKGVSAASVLPPEDVLAGLNRDLLDAQLQDCHFLAALFAVFNERTRTLRWARAGAPYPILVRRGESPRQIKSDGPIVGVRADAEFEVVELRLEPGDTLVFHTDGLDSILAGDGGEPGCCSLDRTEWFRTFGTRCVKEHLEEVETRLADRSPTDTYTDDTTIIALHVQEQAPNVMPLRRVHPAKTPAAPLVAAV